MTSIATLLRPITTVWRLQDERCAPIRILLSAVLSCCCAFSARLSAFVGLVGMYSTLHRDVVSVVRVLSCMAYVSLWVPWVISYIEIVLFLLAAWFVQAAAWYCSLLTTSHKWDWNHVTSSKVLSRPILGLGMGLGGAWQTCVYIGSALWAHSS